MKTISRIDRKVLEAISNAPICPAPTKAGIKGTLRGEVSESKVDRAFRRLLDQGYIVYDRDEYGYFITGRQPANPAHIGHRKFTD